MISRRSFLLVPPAIGLSAIGCAGVSGRIPPSLRHRLAGMPAPDFQAKSALSSQMVQVPGPTETTIVTVVDFWASWCEACLVAMPALEHVYRRNRDRGVDVVGVSVDDEPQNALGTVMSLGTTFPIVIDRHQSIQAAYDVGKIPTTFVIDHNGLVRWIGRDMGMMEQAVDRLLALNR